MSWWLLQLSCNRTKTEQNLELLGIRAESCTNTRSKYMWTCNSSSLTALILVKLVKLSLSLSHMLQTILKVVQQLLQAPMLPPLIQTPAPPATTAPATTQQGRQKAKLEKTIWRIGCWRSRGWSITISCVASWARPSPGTWNTHPLAGVL